MIEKMEQQARMLEEIYCPRCFLATPTWRGKCIHCQAKLEARPKLQARPVPRAEEPERRAAA